MAKGRVIVKGFIEVTYEGQKYCVNVRYIIRFHKSSQGTVIYLRGNGAFSVLPVEESYEEVKAKIIEASKAI